MPPVFKKPLAYDPTLAERTLANQYNQSDAARDERKRQMLAELGLTEDPDEDQDGDSNGEESVEDEEDSDRGQQRRRQMNDVTPEYLEERRQQIEDKGYSRFLQDLLQRSRDNLADLRSDPRVRQYPCVDVIAELGYELEEMQQDNDDLRRRLVESLDVDLPLGRDDDYDRLSEQVEELRRELIKTQAAERKESARASDLQAQLRQAQASLKDAGATASKGTAAAAAAAAAAAVMPEQLSMLEGQVAAQESRLKQATRREAELMSTITELRQQLAAGGGAGATGISLTGAQAGRRTGGGTGQGVAGVEEAERKVAEADVKLAEAARKVAEAERKVVELERARDDYAQQAETLQARVHDAEASVHRKEQEFTARIQDMATASEDAQASAVAQQLRSVSEQHTRRVEELQSEIKQKETTISQLQGQRSEAQRQAQEAKAHAERLQTKAEAADEIRGQADALQRQLSNLHALREAILAELAAVKSEMYSDKAVEQLVKSVRDREVQAIRRLKADMKDEVESAEQAAREAREEVERVQRQSAEQLRVMELEAQAQVEVYRHKWRVEFDRRRRLHNQVVDLKGSIRVLCRVRPLLDKERANGAKDENMPVRCTSEEVVRVTLADKNEKDFEFDRLFGANDGQETVFDEVSVLITSVLDGYNVCMMAYGQTGSGKTFTMEGPDSNPGVNTRALAELFKVASERSADFEYTFQASILEIYNEQIYDLLVAGKQQDDKLDVKQNPEGGMYVPGLKVERVADSAEVAALMQRGKNNRSTFATNMNEHSSRSHLVLSVYVTAVAKRGNSTMRGKLHLIDLAGSERLSKTGAQGDRLKEAQNINKSLSALGDVIQALQQREKHIPYRNSKLTRLLEDSLGSSSKCIMVVNVSPAAENVPETKCSLEFASRARKVDLGRARAMVETPGSGNRSGSSTPGGNTTPSGAANSTGTSRFGGVTPGSASRRG